MCHRLPAILTAMVLGSTLAAPPDQAGPIQTDVFIAGTEGYHTYRIPSLLVTAKGTLLAFCEGRKTSRSDHGDVDLVLKRSNSGGATWGPLTLVYEEGGTAKITIGNPCPVVDRSTGTIWLPFCRDNDDVFVTHSTDDGVTWSKPVRITASVKKSGWTWYATGPGVGIQLKGGPHAGRLLIPCNHGETIEGRPVKSSHVFWSDDHGKTWTLGGSVGPHTNECQVVDLRDGSLLLNMRNHWAREGGRADRANRRAVAISKDGGATWSEPRFEATLIEPVCQGSLIRHPTQPGKLLFSNPASTSRQKLTIRLSDDDGLTWPAARTLHAGPAAYSCLAVLPDGTITCLYERGRKNSYETLTLARFSLEWLLAGRGLQE